MVARSVWSCLPSAVRSSLKAQEQNRVITMGWSPRFSFQLSASVPLSSSVGKLQLKFQPMLSHHSALLLHQREGSQESLFLKQKKKNFFFFEGGGSGGGEAERRVEEGSGNTWRWFLCIRQCKERHRQLFKHQNGLA